MASHITLPDAPVDAWHNGVAIWEEPLMIDTYDPIDPAPYPAFLDQRVYQGSSGRVYPLPFHERISSTARERQWQAVHLENTWIRLVVLPELGGRVHIVYDKVSGQDIFYRNNVIKPALVGLAGPWISGGIEFNWPQHHRPATYLPTDSAIRRDDDGTATLWCSDHDPFARMKGMHGVRLRPDSARIEVHARLYNRTELPQTFLWWANVAAAVNDDYQSFFPADVTHVADHAKRAVVTFPRPDEPYYGIDYAARAGDGGDADRIDWYRNIPVPTSYMALDSSQDFFGGYDHGRGLGFVHVAPHEISPGKKQWTWGDAPFGWAWDRNLTDDDGPYVELMAGVYTDNQPDFAYLGAGETKTFTEAWYPIREIGPVVHADDRVAISLVEGEEGTRIGVNAAEVRTGATIRVLDEDGHEISSAAADLSPARALVLELPGTADPLELTVMIEDVTGTVADVPLSGQKDPDVVAPARMATAPPLPEDIERIDELVRIAVYLDQYRHATRSSSAYLEEALRRDPEESRALLHLGRHAYDRGALESAIDLLGRSAALATQWTTTPASGEAHYRLGLALDRAGRPREAAPALATAMWDTRWAVPSRFALARIRLRAGRIAAAADLLHEAIEIDPRHHQSRNLLARIQRDRADAAGAAHHLEQVLARDPLDAWARDLHGEDPTADATIMLDVALEYAAAGFTDDARRSLRRTEELAPSQPAGQVNVGPLAHLHRAALDLAAGDPRAAREAAGAASGLSIASAHPSRLDDALALERLTDALPELPLPPALLGHWLYDHGRHHDAIARWEQSLAVGADPQLAAVLHRNLGIASFNIRRDQQGALSHYAQARRLAPEDAKLLFEADLLAARTGATAQERLDVLERARDFVTERDDLTIALANLLLDVGRIEQARALLQERRFQPWEGGEGQVLAAWDRANIAWSRHLLEEGRADEAIRALRTSFDVPTTLGEDRHALANVAAISLALGDALDEHGDAASAASYWEDAARSTGDFIKMEQKAYGTDTLDAARALTRLGRHADADALVADVQRWVEEYARADVEIDYFATSLPEMLVFHEDLAVARDRDVARIRRALEGWDAQRTQQLRPA